MRTGCYFYFGVTQIGKTSLALAHLRDEISETGKRALILDCMPAKNFRTWRHEPDLGACIDRLAAGGHAVYSPKSREDLDNLLQALHEELGPTLVLWDECSIHMPKEKLTPCQNQALRGWGHTDHVYFLITQRPGDLPSECWVLGAEVYVFRLEREPDLQRVETDFGFPREVIKVLPHYEPRIYRRDRRDGKA